MVAGALSASVPEGVNLIMSAPFNLPRRLLCQLEFNLAGSSEHGSPPELLSNRLQNPGMTMAKDGRGVIEVYPLVAVDVKYVGALSGCHIDRERG